MIATTSPLRTTSSLPPSGLTFNNNLIRSDSAFFFNIGFRFSSPRKMQLLRNIGGGCFRSKQGKGVIKVEADSGGEDVFDASFTNPLPDHLVIMVNGIIGRYKQYSLSY